MGDNKTKCAWKEYENSKDLQMYSVLWFGYVETVKGSLVEKKVEAGCVVWSCFFNLWKAIVEKET